MLLQHSVSWQVDEAEFQIRQTMEAIEKLGYQTVAIYPCSDPGYQAIVSVLEEYRNRSYLRLFPNIDFTDFWGLLNVAGAFIGNSSAGVMETPSFRIPFVNIGIRQQFRLRANNVIDVGHDRDEIVRAIQLALFDETVRERVRGCISPYGDGRASERIVDVIEHLEPGARLLRKQPVY